MVPLDRILAFAVTAVVIIAIPGPSVLFIVGRALAGGRSVALRTVVGNATGQYVQVGAVAAGIGALAERSVAAFTIIKLAGAAYLLYLGAQTFRHRRSLAAALDAAAGPQERRPALGGFVVGVTNPKTVVFLVAILPQFVERRSGDAPLQILLLGAVFATIALVYNSGWSLLADRFRRWFARSPRRLERIGGAGGLAIMVTGFTLAATGRKD